MFKRHDAHLRSDVVCLKAVDDLVPEDFQYYDKDGFELNIAEQKYYRAAGHPIHHPVLNHTCYQEPWFELERDDLGLILDHSLILHRCNYNGAALDQLRKLQSTIPAAQHLIATIQKWGFDFDLDAVSADGTVYEVLHVEYDGRNYQTFKERMISFEYTVRHTDWQDAARRVWDQRSQWQGLVGFEQNHWKANFLLGWKKAEYTEKTV
jgi:hypothetical protein